METPLICPCGARCIEIDENWILSEKVDKSSSKTQVYSLNDLWDNTKPLRQKFKSSREDSGHCSLVSEQDGDGEKASGATSESSAAGGGNSHETGNSGNESERSVTNTGDCNEVENSVYSAANDVDTSEDESRDPIGLLPESYSAVGEGKRTNRMFFQTAQWWCNIGERYDLDLYFPKASRHDLHRYLTDDNSLLANGWDKLAHIEESKEEVESNTQSKITNTKQHSELVASSEVTEGFVPMHERPVPRKQEPYFEEGQVGITSLRSLRYTSSVAEDEHMELTIQSHADSNYLGFTTDQGGAHCDKPARPIGVAVEKPIFKDGCGTTVADITQVGWDTGKSIDTKPKVVSKLKKKEVRRSVIEIDQEAKWLNWVEKQFEIIAGEDQAIDLQEFKTALKVKKSFFAERFFTLFDTDKSGTIELPELMDGLVKLTKGSPKEKLRFLFDVYDVDGSGTIDPEELETVLRSCMEESSMQLSDEAIKSLTMALFKSADEDDSGEITFEELVSELERHPGVMENLTISAAQWLKPPDDKPKENKPGLIQHYCNRRYLQNNMRKVVFFFAYLLITAIHFIASAIAYREYNFCVIIARGFGMALNFNCTFVVVLMLRSCLSWLRTTKLGSYLPIDQSIMFHKLVGVMIALLSFGHTLAHLGNIAIVLYFSDEEVENFNSSTQSIVTDAPKLEFWEYLFTLRAEIGYVGPGFAYISGVLLDIVLFIMVLCSMGFVRRSGHFQVFYWTHMLFVVFWLLLILHAPRFGYFFVAPGFVYILERIWRSKAMKLYKYGKMHVSEVHLLPSKVTHLVIDKPESMRYKPGDYIFLNIPDIAAHEWHPFTISSAPELEGKFWVHIRSAGHWTGKVHEYFSDLPEYKSEEGFVNLSFENMENGNLASGSDTENGSKSEHHNTNGKSSGNAHAKKVKVEVYIDGPFGTPTREIFDTEHAVLVGSGIGVTPFAAILQSVMYRYTASKITCPHCDQHWYGDIPKSVMKLRRMDFIWINRDQKSFEWFIRLLAQLELQQTNANSEDFLQMQMYMTSALSKNDMKGLGLQMALEILHKQENKDVMTGLKTRTQAGRPDWNKVFDNLAQANKGKVKMFFCGPPMLGKELKQHCMKRGFVFSQEHF